MPSPQLTEEVEAPLSEVEAQPAQGEEPLTEADAPLARSRWLLAAGSNRGWRPPTSPHLRLARAPVTVAMKNAEMSMKATTYTFSTFVFATTSP